MTPWSPIDDPDNPAPRDGTWIVIGKAGWDVFPKAKWGSTDAVDGVIMGWVFADHDTPCLVPNTSGDGFLGWAEDIEDGNMPTHWTPLPPEASDHG